MTVSIYLGDWRDVFESWPSPCVLICDPPYGIDYVSGWSSRLDAPRTMPRAIVGDGDTRERDEAMERIGWTSAAVFGPSVKKMLRLPPWSPDRVIDVLVLDKNGVGMGDVSWPWTPDTETIAIYGDGWAGHRGSSIIRGPMAPRGALVHPNQKGVRQLCEIVRKAPHGLPIVDPFMGSGVVGSACMLEGRDYFGAEIDPAHFAVASDRIGVSNGPLFAGVDA